MPMPRTAAATLIAAATGLVLTGCIAQPQAPVETEPVETSQAPVETAEETQAPVETADTEPAADGDLTAPGTQLAIGETAVVPFSYGTDVVEVPVSVAVTDVSEGSIADFEAAGLDDDFLSQLDGYQTYYVTIEATKVDPADAALAYTSIDTDFGAIDSNGNGMSPVSIIGDFAPCNTESFGTEIDAGETLSTCYIVAATETVDFGAATYEPYEGPYSSYDGEPLAWS